MAFNFLRKFIEPTESAKPDTVNAPAPSQRPINPDVSAGFSSIVMQAFNVLVNPDIAYRTDRKMSEQMVRDPMIAGPLMKRMLATAQLEWQILPEDENDESQIVMAEEIQKIIRRIPRFCDLKSDLLWATWYGTGVSELFWEQDDNTNQWCIEKHRPHRGDKFVYDIYGNPRLLTKTNQTAGRELTKSELDRLVIHVFRPEDGSFFEGAEAGYLFKGRGLRDYVWAYWWLKHNALRFWLNFMERYGGGMALGRYPMNNAAAKTAIESVLRNMINDSRVSIPVPAGAEDPKTYGVEVVTVAGAGEQSGLFKTFIDDWAGKHIRLLIEGQDQANQTSGDGLGSGRADALQDMFRSLRDFDAVCLQDTLTAQLVSRVQKYNFGEQPFQCRFEFVLDGENYDESEKRVNAAKNIGIDVSKDWVYDTLGIPRPKDDDEIIEFGTMAQEAHEAAMQPKPQQFSEEPEYIRRYAEAIASDYADEKGRWVTMNGTHVFIKDGEIQKGPSNAKKWQTHNGKRPHEMTSDEYVEAVAGSEEEQEQSSNAVAFNKSEQLERDWFEGKQPVSSIDGYDIFTSSGNFYAFEKNAEPNDLSVGVARGEELQIWIATHPKHTGKGIGAELAWQLRKDAPFRPSGGMSDGGKGLARAVHRRFVEESKKPK